MHAIPVIQAQRVYANLIKHYENVAAIEKSTTVKTEPAFKSETTDKSETSQELDKPAISPTLLKAAQECQARANATLQNKGDAAKRTSADDDDNGQKSDIVAAATKESDNSGSPAKPTTQDETGDGDDNGKDSSKDNESANSSEDSEPLSPKRKRAGKANKQTKKQPKGKKRRRQRRTRGQVTTITYILTCSCLSRCRTISTISFAPDVAQEDLKIGHIHDWSGYLASKVANWVQLNPGQVTMPGLDCSWTGSQKKCRIGFRGVVLHQYVFKYATVVTSRIQGFTARTDDDFLVDFNWWNNLFNDMPACMRCGEREQCTDACINTELPSAGSYCRHCGLRTGTGHTDACINSKKLSAGV